MVAAADARICPWQRSVGGMATCRSFSGQARPGPRPGGCRKEWFGRLVEGKP